MDSVLLLYQTSAYAYQSFKWKNNAKGNAGVTVVIICLRNVSSDPKHLYSENIKYKAKNINAYLLDASNVYVAGKVKPISNLPIMTYGNMPLEGGFLRFDRDEKDNIFRIKGIDKFVRKVIGGEEFIKGNERYCYWIEDNDLEEALMFDEIKTELKRFIILE